MTDTPKVQMIRPVEGLPRIERSSMYRNLLHELEQDPDRWWLVAEDQPTMSLASGIRQHHPCLRASVRTVRHPDGSQGYDIFAQYRPE